MVRFSEHVARLSVTVTYTIVYDYRETLFVGNLLIGIQAFSFKSNGYIEDVGKLKARNHADR